jgi:predicted mannosyl-3-phosphoglycerate phosphatase (HAD superfamily)
MMNSKNKIKKVNGKLMVLIENGCVCVFDKNLKEFSVNFRIRGGVSVILLYFKGGGCNFPLNK